MPDTATKTAEQRIAELEEKVEDLASFVGRLTASVHGATFREWDPGVDELLLWHEEIAAPGTEDECLVSWWYYDTDAVKALYEASDDA